ncbi:MAG: hypothetical protein COA42_14540 [Alteromonadaceae bacterium]|nr:MAG: hypothetical protein COA42_14540 [Alteromonadaceae bacterium]
MNDTTANTEKRNIIILVAGTVDPVSAISNLTTRAASYSGSNDYWAENPEFTAQLNALSDESEMLALFPSHGWSGDNTKENREIAGAYLANRLCGSNGEIAYYSGYRKIPVSFHLIGHSHGGNVINELSKRAAVAAEWPEQWKIKSITYLSTPFFNDQHQLDSRALATDCNIINVFNRFDLTQRLIANFTMYDLSAAIALSKKETPELLKHLQHLGTYPYNEIIDRTKAVFEKFSPLSFIFNSAKYKYNNEDGHYVFQGVVELLDTLSQLISLIKDTAKTLSTTLYTPSDKNVQKYIPPSTHYFISEDLYDNVATMLDKLTADLNHISQEFSERDAKQDYRITPLISEISPTLNRVIDFMSIDTKEASGSFVDLLYSIIKNQIQNFDNTSADPKAQLPEHLHEHLHHIDVSENDPYHQQGILANFDALMQQLESIEDDYQASPNQQNLLRMIITLASPQAEVKTYTQTLKKGLDLVGKFIGKGNFSPKRIVLTLITLRGALSPARKTALHLKRLLVSYSKLFDEFNIDLLKPEAAAKLQTEAPKPNAEEKESSPPPPVGGLMHFSTVSHSISRQVLGDEAMRLLRSSIDTPLKK